MSGATSAALLATQVAGGALSTVGAFSGARQQRNALNYQADIADINAQTAELGAQSAMAQGEKQQQASRLKYAGLKSSQRTAMAASGIDLGSDTANNILTSTDYLAEMDDAEIRANTVRNAWGYRQQGMNYQNEALTRRASADSISPFMAGATSLLGSASGVAEKWYQYKKVKG